MNGEPASRRGLFRLAGGRYVMGLVLLALLLFLSAGTLGYWQAWVYLGTLFLPMLGVLAYLLRNDPALLGRRMRMREREAGQEAIIRASVVFFLLLYVLPGLDRRFGWSSVSTPVVLVADLVVVGGYVLFFLVLRTNSYAARTVQVDAGQKVISSGPYALVRHPMYLAMSLIVVPTPMALGSYWATAVSVLVVPILAARICAEETTLAGQLAGYPEYVNKVRHRLFPGVW